MIDIDILRKNINELDTELKSLLQKRMALTEQVGLYKKEG
jgi:chorismate mutase